MCVYMCGVCVYELACVHAHVEWGEKGGGGACMACMRACPPGTRMCSLLHAPSPACIRGLCRQLRGADHRSPDGQQDLHQGAYADEARSCKLPFTAKLLFTKLPFTVTLLLT